MLTTLPDKTYRRAAYILMGVLAALVFFTFRHYGVSWDEEIQSQYGQAVYDYYASGFVDHRYNQIFNLYLYGGMFDGLAAMVDTHTPFTLYQTRHLLNALIGLLSLWGVWRLGRLLGGGFVGFTAMLLLVATPTYYGHFFNNPKDIPFAAGIVWSLYYMTKTFLAYPKVRWSLMLKLGIVYGLTLGVRVNGIMSFGFWGMLLTAMAFVRARPFSFKSIWQAVRNLLAIGVPVTMVSYAVMLACWPWAQEAPLENPLRAIMEFSNFPQVVEVLLDGTTYMSTELPWTYVPLYFGVQLPILHLAAIFAGLALLPVTFRHLGERGKRWALALMLLTAGFPLAYAMIRHPALYDTVRHFTFVLPLLMIVAALAMRPLYDGAMRASDRLSHRGARRILRLAVALAGLALFALPIQAMLRLHPYEYIFLNRLTGGVPGGFGQFELDYWGSSFKEAAEKLQKIVADEGGVPPGRIYKIAICGPWSAAMMYLPPDYDAVGANEPADFFLATTRWMCQNMRPGKELFRVERMGVPLSVMKDLRGTEDGRLGMPNYRKEQEDKAKEEKDGK